MRDPVNRLILLVGVTLIIGIAIGVKASDLLDRPPTAAEIAAELRLT